MLILDSLADYLTDSGVVSSGWTLYKTHLPDTPDQAICLAETGGERPDPFGIYNATATFQIRVRGAKGSYSTVRTKWREIFDVVNSHNYDALDGGEGSPLYVYLMVLSDGPLPFEDSTGRVNLTMNVRAQYERA